MDFVSIIAGVLLGIFAGLVPGIHTNTIAGVLSSIQLAPEALAGAIAAAAASQVVFQFIPAIFMFIPDAETVVSVMPGQRMLMKGKGLAAIYVCTVSCVLSAWLALLLLPFAVWLMPLLYGAMQGAMFPVLALLSIFLLAGEGSAVGFAKASLVFLLSGILGVLVLWLPIMPDPLLPSFSGMFALAAIAVSLGGKIKIPKQELKVEKEIKTGFGLWLLLPVIAGVILGMLSDLLPGISSPAQIAAFAAIFLFFDEPKYLAFIASVAASHQIFAYSALSSIGKARVGSAVVAQEAFGSLGEGARMWLTGITLFGVGAAAVAVFLSSKRIVGMFSGLDMGRMGAAVAVYLLAIILIIDGAAGLFVAVVACCIGVLPPLLGVRRTHLMGLILLPSILSHAGLANAVLSLIFGA